jgi:hypothetical protein
MEISEKLVLKLLCGLDMSGGKDACWPWMKDYNNAGYGDLICGGEHYKTHRLSYQIYVGPITPDWYVVRHKCGNKGCGNFRHLETGTQQANIEDAMAAGTFNNRGIAHSMAKLTEDAALDIYHRAWLGKETLKDIAKSYGIDRGTVWGIKHGRNWNHVTAHLVHRIVLGQK